MLSSGHGMAVALTNPQQLWLPAQDQANESSQHSSRRLNELSELWEQETKETKGGRAVGGGAVGGGMIKIRCTHV